jgi:threonine/homoserine/homoserine lactone efflux protein
MDIAGFTIAILPIALSPGSSFTMIMNNAVRDGFRGVVPVIVGTAFGIYIHAMLAGFGVTRLISKSTPAMETLKISGTLYLLYLSLKMILSGLSSKYHGDTHQVLAYTIKVAAMANLLNVKPVILYLTIVQLLSGAYLQDYIMCASIHVTIMVLFLLLLGLFMSNVTKNDVKHNFSAAFNVVSGGTLLGVTIWPLL